METVTEITDNGPKTIERKVFPGYVLVKMVMSDEAWYIVKSVRGVTGFVGEGNKPIPLTDDEVYQMGVEKHTIENAQAAEIQLSDDELKMLDDEFPAQDRETALDVE